MKTNDAEGVQKIIIKPDENEDFQPRQWIPDLQKFLMNPCKNQCFEGTWGFIQNTL